MRFAQILLEYDHNKMLERYKAALYQRCGRDPSFGNERAILCTTYHDTKRRRGDPNYTIQDHICGFVLTRLTEGDPTPNKQYMAWLITRYINEGIARIEDVYRAREALEKFEAAKRSGWFKRNPDKAKFADIGQFKGLADLEASMDVINPTELLSNTEADRQREAGLLKHGDVKVLFNDSRYKIVSAFSEDAAMFFGRNTKWCTAAKYGNVAPSYLKTGPLYIILDKANNRRWQFHFPSGQFMDERDHPLTFKGDFPSEVWELIEWPLDQLSVKGNITLLQGDEPMASKMIGKMKSMNIIVGITQIGGEIGQRLKDELIERYDYTSPTISQGEGWRILFFEEFEAAMAYNLKHNPKSWSLFNNGFLEQLSMEKLIVDVTWCSIVELEDDTYYVTEQIARDNDPWAYVSRDRDEAREGHSVRAIEKSLAEGEGKYIFFRFHNSLPNGLTWGDLWPYLSGQEST